jgi:Reverse transcriptase (RNA-dependent DNA polymerase).
MRTLLAVAAHKGWKVFQLDITTAFLHGDIDVDVYMKQPVGFVDGTGKVCKLRKTLYGLKQAPRAWYYKLKDVLHSLGFTPVSADTSFWVCTKNEVLVYISTVVDDMLITSPNEDLTHMVMEGHS